MLTLLLLNSAVFVDGAISASGSSTVSLVGTSDPTTAGALSATGAATVNFVGENAAVPVIVTPGTVVGGGGGGGMMSPELLRKELKRIERRQKRTPKTHVIKIGDWPEEVGFVEDDPLDMGEILSHQPARRAPSQQDSDDEEEAIMMLLTLAA